MKMLRFALLAIALFAGCAPTYAQWQTPNHSVPVGRGASVSGFGNAAPSTAGQALISNGPGADPSFQSLPAGSCNAFTSSLPGCVPASGGGTVTFLRADGTFAAPSPGCLNILSFGGNGGGTTANDTAFNSAWSALAATGGCIYFPAGKYSFTAQLAKTLPNARFAITLTGDGANASILYWPNANGGVQLTWGNLNNAVHIRDLTFSTAQVNNGNAIKLIGVGGVYSPPTDILNVTVRGDDWVAGTVASSECWGTGVYLHSTNQITINNLNTYGASQAPGSAGCGQGLVFEGDTATSEYATVLNVNASSFNYHALGWLLGSYWQGVTCNACNFNGAVGSSCIQQSGGAAGIQVLLAISNSQLNCGNIGGGAQMFLATAVDNVTVTGTNFAVTGPNNSGLIVAAGGTSLTFIGNIVDEFGTNTGTTGVSYAGTEGTIQGNVFRGLATGVFLSGASSNNVVGLNAYSTVTTKISNSGTSNSVGTATAGSMAGVVP